MILIRNRQRTIPIDTEQLHRDAERILQILNYDSFDLTIIITTNRTIRRYNREYRKKDRPTDILSFPFYPELKAGERIVAHERETEILGDLILSAAYIAADANAYGVTLNERLRTLLVHGICHLLGYDHITDREYAAMQAVENSLIEQLTSGA